MIERTILVNGTPLHTLINENLNTFCIAVYVKAGCMYESMGDNGITHLLEHTIFKNMHHKYDGSFYDLLAVNGLNFTGSTYKEFMCFIIDGPSYGFDFACEVICSVFDFISISVSEFFCEKKRIKAEIRERDERHTLQYVFLRKVWGDAFGNNTVLGTCKSIDNITLDTLNDYRCDVFSTDNCFFFLTGNVTDEQIQFLKDKIVGLNINNQTLNRNNVIENTNSL